MGDNLDLVYKYINGEYIDECLLEKLESNKCFMLQAILASNDKKIYKLCSHKVKIDYVFVKTLMYKFKDDLEFISEVVDYYLNHTPATREITKESLERNEIIIMMDEITKNDRTKDSFKYHLAAATFYNVNRLLIEKLKETSNSKVANEIGLGFIIFFDKYNSSEKLTNFLAVNTAEEILDDKNFEEKLHYDFESPEDIDKEPLNNYILNYITRYDSMLGAYLTSHIELLGQLKFILDKFKRNWDNYLNDLDQIKISKIVREVEHFMKHKKSILGVNKLLYCVAKDFSVANKLASYEQISNPVYKKVMEELANEKEYIDYTLATNENERKYYDRITEIFESNLHHRDKDSKEECKIIKFPTKE